MKLLHMSVTVYVKVIFQLTYSVRRRKTENTVQKNCIQVIGHGDRSCNLINKEFGGFFHDVFQPEQCK